MSEEYQPDFYTVQYGQILHVVACPHCCKSADRDPDCILCRGAGLQPIDVTCRSAACQQLIEGGTEPDPGCVRCGGSGVDGGSGSWRNLHWVIHPTWSRHPRRLPSRDHDGDHYGIALIQLALRLKKEGRTSEAVSMLRVAGGEEGSGAWANYELGHILFAAGDFEQAVAAFEKSYASELDPVAKEWAQEARRAKGSLR